MNQCPNCGLANQPGIPFCQRCGAPLSAPAGQVPGPAAAPGPYPSTPPPAPPPAFAPRAMPAPPGAPPAHIPPHMPPPVLPRQAKAFTWMDVCTVLGFVASIVGYFYTSIVLLPLGLLSSILGFRGDRTRGLAVAGIVLSVIGLLIRLMVILSEHHLLPYWITNGVW